jgi:hypothetical protein
MATTFSARPRSYAALTLVLFAMILVSCDDEEETRSDNRYSALAPFEIQLERNTQTLFRLQAINGEIEIDGYIAPDTLGADLIHITGEREVRSDSQSDADQYLDSLQVNVSESSSEFTIRTDQPDQSNGREYLVRYHVSLPQDMRVDVDQANGTISIVDIRPQVSESWSAEVDQVNGDVFVRDIDEKLRINVVNGTITCSHLVSFPRQNELTAVNGTIEFHVYEEVSAQLSAELVNGTIAVSGLDLQDASYSPTHVSGTLGSGEGEISLTLVNGTIAVSGH